MCGTDLQGALRARAAHDVGPERLARAGDIGVPLRARVAEFPRPELLQPCGLRAARGCVVRAF